jgi:hypothetical protein
VSDLASDDTINGFSNAYFSWLCWLLLVIAAGIAIGGAVASTYRHTLKFVGLLVGIVGAGVAFIALAALAHQGHIPFGTFIGYWSAGPWLAMIGFTTIGVGSMCGEIAT